ncbi:pectate lyase-like adhesive domain-containing protein [Vagococcus lutrae]|uniref:pectate lyase-like adhesive domain-containing protein n=1 Tax=Vagococcus lutrae TaxID=81947 RepID=UPI000F8661BF|nr:pectate lyase-like adhesive domain-containing protein [Vagococcus lutrae]RST92652.1 hypothetical protein CBF33_04415 [Vagococcus lutrae]
MTNRMKVILSLLLIILYFQPNLKIVATSNDLKIETTKPSESIEVESDVEAEANETQENNNTENVLTIESENTLGIVEKILEENVSPALTNPKTDAIQMVTTWGDFVKAVRNEEVRVIKLTQDVINPQLTAPNLSSYQRKTSLEIDGGGHRLDFQTSSIYLGRPDSEREFFMHDITLAQRYAGAESEDIVGTRLNYAASRKWRFRFGNVTTEPSVQRLARATQASVSVYGNMHIDTRAENFYLGDFEMEEGTHYFGNVNYYDFSIFWYDVVPPAQSTGNRQGFRIGKNCEVNLSQTQRLGSTYPAIYSHFKEITVGEASFLNIRMPGNAVRFNDDGSSMSVKANASVVLTTESGNKSVIAFSANKAKYQSDMGASLTIVSNTSQPLVELHSDAVGGGHVARKNNEFILDNPQHFDLRNLNSKGTAMNVGSKKDNCFIRLTETDVELWNKGQEILQPSTISFNEVDYFNVSDNNTSNAETSEEGLKKLNLDDYQRIAAMNEPPRLVKQVITDADSELGIKVEIGNVVDNNGYNRYGQAHFIPVYASENQVLAHVTINEADTKTVKTNQYGEIFLPKNTILYEKDTVYDIVLQKANRYSSSYRQSILDVTPPAPVTIEGGLRQPLTRDILSGKGEPFTKVFLYQNKILQPFETTVSAEGDWSLNIQSLERHSGDLLQIVLEDTSCDAEALLEKPSTYTGSGNRTPLENVDFHDATFKKATSVLVTGELKLSQVPSQIDFGKVLISNQTQKLVPRVDRDLIVEDTRGPNGGGWSLKLRLLKPMTNESGRLLNNVMIYKHGENYSQISDEAQVVEVVDTSSEQTNVSKNWNEKAGLQIWITPEKQLAGQYKSVLSWSLENIPANEVK